MKYPEHEKLKALNKENEIVGQFIEWLQGKYELANYKQNLNCDCCDGPCDVFEDKLVREHFTITGLLVDYYGKDRC